jgi:hypothetical protein
MKAESVGLVPFRRTFGRTDLGAGRGVHHQGTAIVDELPNLPDVDHFALATGSRARCDGRLMRPNHFVLVMSLL